jgi:uncharacterized phage protein (TIGR01671 family)
MSREIKFRGLSPVLKKWEYGDLITDGIDSPNKDLAFIFPTNANEYSFDHICRVSKKTVGQYTGLHDKNGNEIYEGDVVSIPDNWQKYGWMAGEERNIYFKDGCFRFAPEEGIKYRGHPIEDDANKCEVMGNIHELINNK